MASVSLTTVPPQPAPVGTNKDQAKADFKIEIAKTAVEKNMTANDLQADKQKIQHPLQPFHRVKQDDSTELVTYHQNGKTIERPVAQGPSDKLKAIHNAPQVRVDKIA